MTDKAEFERLLDVYGFRCERFGQDLSTHARAQVVSAFAALANAAVAGEARTEGGDPASPRDDSDRTYDKPIGYLPVYELGRLHSGHSANLRSAKFGPSALDGDVPVYLDPPKADAAPQASEAVRDAGITASEDVVLPPLPSPPRHRGHAMFAGSQVEAYARAAVLTDRQRRADDSALWRALAAASNYIDTLGGDSKPYRAALSAQPGAQNDA